MLATGLMALLAACGSSGTSASGLPSVSVDPSFESYLNEPGNRDALDACVDVLILQSWASDGLREANLAEGAEIFDRMLEAGSKALVANYDKYEDFYFKLSYPGVFIRTGDEEQLQRSLSDLRLTCEGFGFEY